MTIADDPWAQLLDARQQAWAAGVLAVFGRVRGFFVNKVGDEADELTQRTFTRVQQIRERYDGRGSARSFVLGIAHLVLLEHLRERYRHQVEPLEDISIAAFDPRPSSVLAQRAEQRLVLQALRSLTLEHQTVLELYYWEDMSDPEIADVLATNANTIRGRRTRARERLRLALAAIDGQPGAVESTSTDLERWARSIREQLGAAT